MAWSISAGLMIGVTLSGTVLTEMLLVWGQSASSPIRVLDCAKITTIFLRRLQALRMSFGSSGFVPDLSP